MEKKNLLIATCSRRPPSFFMRPASPPTPCMTAEKPEKPKKKKQKPHRHLATHKNQVCHNRQTCMVQRSRSNPSRHLPQPREPTRLLVLSNKTGNPNPAIAPLASCYACMKSKPFSCLRPPLGSPPFLHTQSIFCAYDTSITTTDM